MGTEVAVAIPLPLGQRRAVMTPKELLEAKGLSITAAAKMWGISTTTISRPVKGERWPNELVLVRFHELSEGAVTLSDWIETCRPLLEGSGILNTRELMNG